LPKALVHPNEQVPQAGSVTDGRATTLLHEPSTLPVERGKHRGLALEAVLRRGLGLVGQAEERQRLIREPAEALDEVGKRAVLLTR